ncbi:MAG TPA: efflux RND transporter periplasmic adaptor subunit [Thermoanaerobaculia bacterium]|nr:efflux RND transporter periplasmic adaptor subunit [Thermoanaerobaculia bacterium]
MKKKRTAFVAVAVVLLGAAAVALRLRSEAVPVDLGRSDRGPVVVTVDEEGKTRVVDRFVVSAPVSGRLARLEVHEGDALARGDVVARLDPLPLDARTRAELSARHESTRAAEKAAGARELQAAAAAEQAKRNRDRIEKLAKRGVMAPEEREQAELAETVRLRELEAARLVARAAGFEAAAAKAALLAAESGRGEALTVVRCPVAGRVLKVLEESERAVAAGTPLLEVGDPSKLEIVLDVLSRDAVHVRPGARMWLEEWGGPEPLPGAVRLVEPSAFTKLSALGVEEQRVHVVGDLESPPATLGDGFRVEARIVVAEVKDVVRVPASALFRKGDSWAVFSVAEGRARLRTVETGLANRAHVEIRGGLADADSVVLHPSDRVADGVRVRPRG